MGSRGASTRCIREDVVTWMTVEVHLLELDDRKDLVDFADRDLSSVLFEINRGVGVVGSILPAWRGVVARFRRLKNWVQDAVRCIIVCNQFLQGWLALQTTGRLGFVELVAFLVGTRLVGSPGNLVSGFLVHELDFILFQSDALRHIDTELVIHEIPQARDLGELVVQFVHVRHDGAGFIAAQLERSNSVVERVGQIELVFVSKSLSSRTRARTASLMDFIVIS